MAQSIHDQLLRNKMYSIIVLAKRLSKVLLLLIVFVNPLLKILCVNKDLR